MTERRTPTAFYLDSNIIIAALERPVWSSFFVRLFARAETRDLVLVTSEVSLAEVLVGPMKQGTAKLLDAYLRLLGPESAFTTVPVTRSILYSAAHVRATSSLKLIDAIHLATAIEAGCDHFLTNDARLGAACPSRMRWLTLAAVGAQAGEGSSD